MWLSCCTNYYFAVYVEWMYALEAEEAHLQRLADHPLDPQSTLGVPRWTLLGAFEATSVTVPVLTQLNSMYSCLFISTMTFQLFCLASVFMSVLIA